MKRKKDSPVQSVKTTFKFYRFQVEKHLPKSRGKMLELAKEELRILFGRNN